MTLNQHKEDYSTRLIENMRDIPYTIFEHLLGPESILRPKQREASEFTAQRIFEEQLRAIAMIMPTSTGKTVILAQMIAALQQDEVKGQSPKKIVIVTDTKEGILQTQEKLRLYAGIDCGLYYSDKKDLTKPVITTTYNSWQEQDFPLDPQDIDMVILDEAHEAISDARLEKLKQHTNAIWLALTASPTYSQERSLLQHFALGYRMSMEEAVQNKLVASFRNIVLDSDIEIDLNSIRSRGKDYDKRVLNKLINTKARNRIGIEYLLFGRHFDTGEPIRKIKGIVSCSGTKHAESFADEANALYEHFYPGQAPEHGFVRFVSGSTKDRRDVLSWHRAGKVGYLAYADLLNQNYDDCGIGVDLNLRPTQSWVLATQRGGRPGRLDELNPGKIALIIDVYDKYKGQLKKKPLFYAHAIGTSAIITEEARILAEKNLALRKNDVMDLSQIPEVQKMIEKLELSIITDEESIFSLFSPEEEVRNKTEDDISLTEMAKLFGISETPITSALKRLLEDWRLHEHEPEKYNKPVVVTQVVRTRRGLHTDNRLSLTIPRDHLEEFKKQYLPMLSLRPKEEDDITITDAVQLTGLGDKRVTSAFNKLKNQWEAHSEDPDNQPRPEVNIETIRISTGNATLSIKQAQLGLFKKNYLAEGYLRNKTADDLSISEICKQTGHGETTIRRRINALKSALKAHEADPENAPKPTVEVNRVKNEKGQAGDTIPKVQLDLFKELLLRIVSPEDYLSTADLVEKSGRKLQEVQTFLKKMRDTQKKHETDTKKFPEPAFNVEEVILPGAPRTLAIKKSDYALYNDLHEQELSTFNATREKTDQDLTLKDLVDSSGYSEGVILSVFKRIKEDWKAYEQDPEKIGIPSVSLDTVRIGGRIATSIKSEDLANFMKTYLPQGTIRKKVEGDYGLSDIETETGISRSVIGRSLKRILKQKEDYERNPDKGEKPSIDIYPVRYKSGIQWVIPKDQFDGYKSKYLEIALIPNKLHTQITPVEFARLSGLSKDLTLEGFKACMSARQEADSKEEHIDIQKVKVPNNTTLAVFAADIPQLVQRFIPKIYGQFTAQQDEIMRRIDEHVKANEPKPRPE